MKNWSPAAQRCFEDYCERRRAALLASGADPDEVFVNWRTHVTEETAMRPGEAVTAEDIYDVLAKLDLPPNPPADDPPTAPVQKPQKPYRINIAGLIIIGLFGVFLPALTLIIEALTGMCASIIFDPVPTWAHAVCIALVPIAIFLTLRTLRSPERPLWRTTGWLSGLALGIALFYALMFSIITPFACIGIIFMGLGCLPLSPLSALICGVFLRVRLAGVVRKEARPQPAPLWLTMLLGCGLLLVLAVPEVVTQIGIGQATSGNREAHVRGVERLRRWGNENELLRESYLRRNREMNPLDLLVGHFYPPPPLEKVRDIYYRVTGQPFNTVHPPTLRNQRGGVVFDANDWDFDQAGDRVSAKLHGLTLDQSRLDGKVEAQSGTVYLEWTLVFRNAAQTEREARAQILLPPGGVVSRVTLWINGEEREAAFGGRSEVRAAYQKVVARRRDPVLVSYAGPDRVLVQCFPVPRDGGTMKTRIGISLPLTPQADGHCALMLPRFLESNFGLAESLKQAVWLEGDTELAADTALRREQLDGGRFGLRGELAGGTLEEPTALTLASTTLLSAVWHRDERTSEKPIILQRLVPAPLLPPKRLAVVVDGSKAMQKNAETIRTLLARIPAGTALHLLLASDRVEVCEPKALHFEGGCDNVPALIQAWDWAAEQPGGAVLWLHGAQPLESDDTEALLQRWQRRRNGPKVFAYQLGNGVDRIGEKLGGTETFCALSATHDPGKDLGALFDTWAGHNTPLAWERIRLTSNTAPTNAVTGSSHMVRLWAADEIKRLAHTRKQADRNRAVALAKTWQLVTEVSGAVVLETAEQYRDANLQAVDPATTPDIVPEPGTLLLALLGTLLLLLWRSVVRHSWRLPFMP
ncbi:MAG: hypothetical protein EPN23_10070 [Verrucomicrobia bacterium]|nr:MAG: hypothetical protein EPN23_10070 [Verrucomicrobiota bacterium]